IPVLRQWSDPKAVGALGPGKPIGRVVRWFDGPPSLPGAAAIALFLISPEEAKGYGGFIAQTLTPNPGTQWGERSVEKLRRLQPLANEIDGAFRPSVRPT